MRSTALAVTLLLMGCVHPATLLQAPVTSAGGRCGKDLGPSPFQRRDATHILIANFFTNGASAPDFAETVSAQVNGSMRRFQEEELRDPRQFDIAVPEESIELKRLDCFIEGHEEARGIAKALEADLVIWGKAFCNPTSTVQVHSEIHTGSVAAGDRSVINIGTVQMAKPYTVCPSATLYHSERDFRRSAGHNLDLSSLGDLDLPALRTSEPFQLVHFTLGLHFFEQKNFWLAARFFRKSADDVLAGERNVEILETYLGRAYLELPDLERSLTYSRRALARVQGTESPLQAGLLSNIGSALSAQGDFARALEHYRKALALDEQGLGKDHPDIARDLNNIGLTVSAQGDFVRALEHYQRALAIDEQALGKDHPDVAIDLNNIGLALQAQGDSVGALEHYRRALAIDEQALGKEHPDVATDLNNIGSVLKTQGDSVGALEHYRRALAIDEQALGKDHPDVAACLNNIGSVLKTQGDSVGALEHYRRALAIVEDKLGSDHPNTRTVRRNWVSTIAQRSGWMLDGKHMGTVVVRCLRQNCSGLTSGDWLVFYGPTRIRDGKHLRELVQAKPEHHAVTLTIVRDDKTLHLPAHGGLLGIEFL